MTYRLSGEVSRAMVPVSRISAIFLSSFPVTYILASGVPGISSIPLPSETILVAASADSLIIKRAVSQLISAYEIGSSGKEMISSNLIQLLLF